uniref:Neurotransmitter-gated ion-channel ligand binding domain protein n=1 Tax=Angiostrongylus cantonensis TaxID=6313 RepID=A0A0K0CY52_ANGCA
MSAEVFSKRTAFDRHTINYQAWREQMTVCDLLQEYDAAEFVAQFRFRQEWFDDRLRFMDHQGPISPDYRNFEFIHVARDQRLWIPDTFFQNEKNGWYHMLDQENLFLKIRSDGKLIYDRRLTLHLSCSMHLSRYPMDSQNCEIAFASSNGALPNFDIATFTNGSCHSKTNTGEYSCLRIELKLNRVFSFFLLQLYIPSSMLVGVAWVSYWIDWKSTAARVPLSIVTLLTMITTSHAINSNLPPVSYAKSIDIWVGACVVFIFSSLIEYAVVNYMGIMDEHRQMHKAACNRSRLSNVMDTQIYMQSAEQMTTPNYVGDFGRQETKHLLRRKRNRSLVLREDDSGVEFDGIELRELIPSRTAAHVEEGWTFQDTTDLVYIGQRKRVELVRWCSVLSSRGRAERIDIIARIIFPIAFIMFNFAYWGIYLNENEV